MPGNLPTLLAPVVYRVLGWATQDDECGQLLRALAEAIVRHTSVNGQADQSSTSDLPVSAGVQEAQDENHEPSLATDVCKASSTEAVGLEAVGLEAEPTTERRPPLRRRFPRAIPA